MDQSVAWRLNSTHLSTNRSDYTSKKHIYSNHDIRNLQTVSKTTSVIEERLQGNWAARIDYFSAELHEYYKSTQKTTLALHLKGKYKR